MRRTELKRGTKPLARTPLERGTSELKRSKPLRPKKRTNAEFARIYGSEERVLWVKSLPCLVCGKLPSDNHHIVNEGMGRKASYRLIVPLCSGPTGCHRRWDTIGSLALLQAARKARWFAPLLVWDASGREYANDSRGGLWREAESWEGAAEIVDQIWEARGSA
jgi:hypothetical protein